jgi:hypothetical protein
LVFLPETANLWLLGLNRADINNLELLQERPNHDVYKFTHQKSSYVLKWYPDMESPFEARIYELLEKYDVPNLPLIACASGMILFEDLNRSTEWRLATEEDMDKSEIGTAIALWYRHLHQAGYRAVESNDTGLDILSPWAAEITEENLTRAGKILDIENETGLKLAMRNMHVLIDAFKALPQTFNYNDFFYGNLAITCKGQILQAVIFDFDQFCLGPAYSDVRNVIWSLRGDARDAFINTYGPTDERSKTLDAPLSELYGLIIASRREKIPTWVTPSIELVRNGGLESSIYHALDHI